MIATVAILTLNAEEFLDEVLKAVTTQKTDKEYEILVIDSGSTDRTLEIVASYPSVRLHQIPNTEFGHGKTRNLAVQLAKGKYVLFLTQDATPTHDRWLDYMVEPFAISDDIICVFGKQIPRADCFATLKREIFEVFRSFGQDDAIVLHRKTKVHKDLIIANTFLSDVNSAVRKSVVGSKLPYRDVKYAEDQGLGIDTLENGYIKAYVPLGSVYHSHNYRLIKYYKRKFDEAVGLREATGQVMTAGRKELVLGTFKASLKDWHFVIIDRDYGFFRKIHDVFWAPAYNLANRLSIRAASSSKLTAEKREKMSLESKARKNARS